MGSCFSSLSRANTTAGVPEAPPSPRKYKLGSRRWRRKSATSDSLDDPDFHHVSGRLFANGATNSACLYTQQGKKGTNQDAMLVWENFSSRSETVFCGIFDGHGPYGHMVAKKVRDSLPLILSTQWSASVGHQTSPCKNENALASAIPDDTASFSMDDECYESLEIEENGQVPDTYYLLKKSMLKAFKLMDKELKLHPTLDCFCSGTTAVALIKQGQDLVIGNIGDSRAVLAARDADSTFNAIQLTVDLKPDLPREAARIQQCKGRVFALQDEPEVARVWLPNSDSPGLAMARAFGDFCLKDFGLISIPDVFYRHLTEKDEFIILATDGVWDVLTNQEAVDIVASAPSRATAARALVECANRSWRLKYPTSKNDDCAVVCLFLEPTSVAGGDMEEDNMNRVHKESAGVEITDKHTQDSHEFEIEHCGTQRACDEIVPVNESAVEVLSERCPGQSRRSLAECISVADEEEWSALEGITRVNSLLSLPRFLSGDKRSASWRKWL